MCNMQEISDAKSDVLCRENLNLNYENKHLTLHGEDAYFYYAYLCGKSRKITNGSVNTSIIVMGITLLCNTGGQ